MASSLTASSSSTLLFSCKQYSSSSIELLNSDGIDFLFDFFLYKSIDALIAILAINDKNYEVVIDSAKNLSDDYVQYDLSELIRHDEQGFIEPDCDATNELANKYFFVR